MQITQKESDPPTWQFHQVSEPERARVTGFVEQWKHGTIVNPWEPFLISFTDPAVIAAFLQEFGGEIERE